MASTRKDEAKTESKKTLQEVYAELVAEERKAENKVSPTKEPSEESKAPSLFFPNKSHPKTKEAIFAGGCFWGMETQFKKLPGVLKTEVGYIGGHTEHPTYKKVCSETTGHLEAVRVVYDPSQLTFTELALRFFEIHDYTQINGQGNDIGTRYLSRIFYQNSQEKEIAEKLIQALPAKKEIKPDGTYEIKLPATQLVPVSRFWPAEEYHQNFHEKRQVPEEQVCHVRRKLF